MRWIASESILDAEFFECVRKNLFIGSPLHLAGREGMSADNGRILAKNKRYVSCRKGAAIEIAEVAEHPNRSGREYAVAEVVFASCIQPDIPGQRVAILVEESHQSAVMVEMAMTDDESIDFLCIQSEIVEIGKERFRCIAVIEHHRARFTGLHRLQVQRQPKLAMERLGVVLRPRRGDQ